MMKKDYSKYTVTPKTRECFPVAVKKVTGNVQAPEHLLNKNGQTTRFIYDSDSAPFVILDLGPTSPGGYPVFKVASKKGTPILRISYSDSFLPIDDPVHGKNGDFKRGCCKYLGVELPVLPGNPGRFECYTIQKAGEYTFPLIQGQQRFVRIALDTPGTEVELEYFYIHYTSDMSPIDGGFWCDNEKLNKLWYYSVYTVQLASFCHHAWDTLNGWLFPRALTKGNDAGIVSNLTCCRDYTFSFTARIAYNPYTVSGIGCIFRASDQNNGYVLRIDLDGLLYVMKRVNGVYEELKEPVKLPMTLCDQQDYHISVQVKQNTFHTYIDDILVDSTTDSTFSAGSVGFCQTCEKWAMVKDLTVTADDGTCIFEDHFQNGLDQYTFTRTPGFVADGAKRDRLPWIGDLDWAGRNAYYSMRNTSYMKGALDLFTFHQTEEGYVFATCYPENTVKPLNRSYGNYESDIFSAWYVPTVADYFLFTNDRPGMASYYPAVKKDLNYLWRFVEADGLFNQRYETSKGLWDHQLGDYGKNSYNNIIIYDAFCEGSFIAKHLGFLQDAAVFARRAEKMKKGIMEFLFDEKQCCLVKSITDREFCHMSNSYALAIQFFDDKKTAEYIMNTIIGRKPETGKVLSTNIRGAYAYGLEQQAYFQLTEYHKVQTDWGYNGGVGWLEMFEDDNVPHTTYECMTYPPHFAPIGESWGDMSHPDTAMAHILTGFILGIQPLTPGFCSYEIVPHLYGIHHVSGRVPVPGGLIEADIVKSEHAIQVEIEVPENKTGVLKLPYHEGCVLLFNDNPQPYTVTADGRLVTEPLQSGTYYVEYRNL